VVHYFVRQGRSRREKPAPDWYRDCRLIADRLPTPKQMQTLVQGVEAAMKVAVIEWKGTTTINRYHESQRT